MSSSYPVSLVGSSLGLLISFFSISDIFSFEDIYYAHFIFLCSDPLILTLFVIGCSACPRKSQTPPISPYFPPVSSAFQPLG